MNRAFVSAILAAALAMAANATLAALDTSACSFPDAPTVPDGTTASNDDMVAASKAIKEFVTTSEAQLQCLDAAKAAAGEEITQEELDGYAETYNRQVDLLNEIANAFNEQVRVFKSREE